MASISHSASESTAQSRSSAVKKSQNVKKSAKKTSISPSKNVLAKLKVNALKEGIERIEKKVEIQNQHDLFISVLSSCIVRWWASNCDPTNTAVSAEKIALEHGQGIVKPRTLQHYVYEKRVHLEIPHLSAMPRSAQQSVMLNRRDSVRAGNRSYLDAFGWEVTIQWIKSRSADCCPPTKPEFLAFIALLKSISVKSPIKLPSDHVYHRFMDRHSNLFQSRLPKLKDANRIEAEDPEKLGVWFDKYEAILASRTWLPCQILAADKTGIHGSRMKELKVIVPVGTEAHSRDHARLNCHISVLHICAADGNTVAPMTVVEGAQVPAKCLAGAPVGSVAQAQPNGYFTAAMFINFLRHLVHCHIPSQEDLAALSSVMVDVVDQHFWRSQSDKFWCAEYTVTREFSSLLLALSGSSFSARILRPHSAALLDRFSFCEWGSR